MRAENDSRQRPVVIGDRGPSVRRLMGQELIRE
jgi:hypothetical protein